MRLNGTSIVKEPSIRHILVAIDGSPSSEAAWRFALNLARATGAMLTALCVALPRLSSTVAPSKPAALRAESAARLASERVLQAAQAEAEGLAGFQAELQFGDPAAVICARAKALDVDLIAVGSRGMGRVERLMLGSVSRAVAERAHCSVVVVRSPAPSASDR